MQTPSTLLNIGADIAKDTIVVACSEGGFPVREVANQRAAVLAFLKSACGLSHRRGIHRYLPRVVR